MDLKANRTHDSYGLISSKIAFLLNKDSKCNVLVIGNLHLAEKHDFTDFFTNCDFVADPCLSIKCGKLYDLVVWEVKEKDNTISFNMFLSIISNLLSENGNLIFTANNRYCIKKFKFFFKLNILSPNITTTNSYSLHTYKKLLKKAGYKKSRAFVPIPSLENMEEIVTDEKNSFHLPEYVHFSIKVLHSLKIYKFFHDGYFFIASKTVEDGINTFILWLQGQLEKKSCAKFKLKLIQFYLRVRGPLILIVSDNFSKTKFVLRIAVNSIIDDKIKKNNLWTKKILLDPDISNEIKHKIPKPLFSFQYKGNNVYVEEFIDGILAWKIVSNKKIEKQIYYNSIHFLELLNKFTKRKIYVDDKIFNSFIGDDSQMIINMLQNDVVQQKKIVAMTHFLKNKMLHKDYEFVLGHKDYGYGNIFVNNIGDITGVIDWDGATEYELAGVDLLNLIITKYKDKHMTSYHTAIQEIEKQKLYNYETDKQPNNNNKIIHISSDYLSVVLITQCLRLIAKTIQYEKIFLNQKDDMFSLIKWAQENLLTDSM